MPQLLDADEVAEALGVSRRTVERLTERSDLRAVRIGARLVRYAAADVLRVLDPPFFRARSGR